MTTKRKARTLRLTDSDHEIIARLKEHHGITSDNEVIRMALRAALRELEEQRQNKQEPKTSEKD